MDKKIIYEIYRQHEIMGVDKKILKENKFVTLGTDLIKDFITKTQKTIPNVADDVLIGSIRVNKQLVKDILDVLEDPSLFDILSKTEKELFGNIVSQSGEIVDDVYEKLMRDVITQTGKNERALIDTISKATAGGKTLSEVLNQMNGEEDVFLNAVLTQKIAKKIRDVKTGKFTPEVTVSNKTFVDPTTGLEWSSPDVLMIQKQLTQFQKLLKTVGVSGATKYLKDALKIYEPFWVQFIRNWWANLLFNWRKVQEININKAKEFIQNAYNLEKEGSNNEAVRELQKAFSQIILFKKEPKTDINQIIKAFITENPNLNSETIEMFQNSRAAGNVQIREFIQDISDDVYEQANKPWKAEVKSFLELIPGYSAVFNKQLNLANTAKEVITSPLTRWFNLLTWKDPRGAYEVILAMAKRGVKKEVTARMLSYFLAHILLLPALKSVVDTWGNQIEAATKEKYLLAMKTLCDNGLLTEGCKEIKEELNSIEFMYEEDYVKNYLKALPFDLGEMFGQEKWEDGKKILNEDKIFFTYWDDVVNKIWDVIQGSPFPFIGRPKANKIINILENSTKKVSEKLMELGVNPNAEDLEKEIEDFYRRKGEKIEDIKNKGKEVVDENLISIEKDIKPTYPCLFGEGWTVDLVNVNNKPTYVTHNPDWSKKYYLDVIKKDGVTIVSFQATGDKVVC